MADMKAMREKFAGYPNIIQFIEIQADAGNHELLTKLESLDAQGVAAMFEMSLAELDALAASQIEAMKRGRC